MCMKTYDYKDEQKDVKGKVSFVPIEPPTTICGALSRRKKNILLFRTSPALRLILLFGVQTERLNAIQELQTMLSD